MIFVQPPVLIVFCERVQFLLLNIFIISVFASLLEYAAVGYLMKRMKMARERKRNSQLFCALPLGPLGATMARDRRFDIGSPHTEISWTNEQEEMGLYPLSSAEQSPRITVLPSGRRSRNYSVGTKKSLSPVSHCRNVHSKLA